MKRTPRRCVAVATISLMLTLAACALAQPTAAPGDRPVGPARLAVRLGLSEEQAAAAAKLREAGQAERLALRKDVLRLRNELQGEMLADSPDARKVEKLAGEIAALQGKARASRLRQQIEFRKLLTPAQRDKLLLMGPGRGPGPDGRGMRGGRGPGLREGRFPGCDGSGRHFGRGPGRGAGRGAGRGPGAGADFGLPGGGI